MSLPKDYISYNQIKLYKTCPLKYYFTYIEKIQTPISDKILLGSVFHSIIEYYLNKKIESKEPDNGNLIDVFLEKYELAKNERKVVWTSSSDEVKKRGIAFVKYFLKEMANFINPLMVEKELEVELPNRGVTLRGIIDLVEKDFSITDFKTTTSKWSKSRVNSSYLQILIYKYLFEKSFCNTIPEVKFKIIYSKNHRNIKHQEINIKPKENDIEKMLEQIDYVIENIDDAFFYKNESYMCNFCEFKYMCKDFKSVKRDEKVI